MFQILVQEKGILKNLRVDFKTLADVLIQQIVIHHVDKMFLGMGQQVFGEEDNEFLNTLGEKIVVEIKESEEETCNLLTKVLDGDKQTAGLLAQLTHEEALDSSQKYLSEEDVKLLQQVDVHLGKTAFWVDPIDGTHHYVKDLKDEVKRHGVCEHGLECVTVLIGAYDIHTGLPILGVVFEPFNSKLDDGEWKPRCFWSCSVPGASLNNFESLRQKTLSKRAKSSSRDEKLVVVSPNDDELLDVMMGNSDKLKLVTAGASGYKASCVYKGLVDLYVCSSDNCYKWDTCATQSMLMSIGGGISHFKPLLAAGSSVLEMSDEELLSLLKKHSLRNTLPNTPDLPTWANIGGMVAYTNTPTSLHCLRAILKAYHKRKL